MIAAGRHLLLEGPVGVGKTTLALAVCELLGRRCVRVDGDERCTEARLAGWFDPALVTARGYVDEAFVPGPLLRAMRGGHVLLLNELNRLPESTQHVLLPALDESLVQVPQRPALRAAPGFVVVATQNPAEQAAVGRLSEALRDRFERLSVDYQSAVEEEAIVAATTGCPDAALVRAAVRLTRATRVHARLRRGASVRGAIAMVELAERLKAGGAGRQGSADDVGGHGAGSERAPSGRPWSGPPPGRVPPEPRSSEQPLRWESPPAEPPPDPPCALLRRAAQAALAGRVEPSSADVRPALVVRELCTLLESGVDPEDALLAVPEVGGGSRDAASGRCSAREAARLHGRHGGDGDDSAAGPPDDPACRRDDRHALAQALRAAPEELDGWRLAEALSAGRLRHAGRRVYLCAQHLAAGAVLRRAGRLVGPLRGATKLVREPVLEPWSGELDVEATVENLVGKTHPEVGDLIMQRRAERRRQVVLMIDTSLSMAGEKAALAAVAAAVLALKVALGDLAVVLFADAARAIVRFGEEAPPDEIVRRMLAVPCGGGTDLSAALVAGHAELARGRDPRRCGLLVSDGVFTSGVDPRPAAAGFGPLHVLLTEEQPAAGQSGRPVTTWISPRRRVGEAIARAADGGVVRVDGFAVLPRRMLEVADRVLR